MLQTELKFAENGIRFIKDDEIISFLESEEALKSIYDEMIKAEGIAAVYPLVIPKSDADYDFDLMMIIKQEKATELGQWEIFVAENFVKAGTNLATLFSYIEFSTNSQANELLHTIQQELKGYRTQFGLQGKTFLSIDGDAKIIAFG